MGNSAPKTKEFIMNTFRKQLHNRYSINKSPVQRCNTDANSAEDFANAVEEALSGGK